MTQSSQPAPSFDEEALVAYLHTQPDVAAAYLFGSHAQGRAHLQNRTSFRLRE